MHTKNQRRPSTYRSVCLGLITAQLHNQLRNQLRNVGDKIGVVPKLNREVAQPDSQFPPPQYQTSILAWKEEIWRNPARAKKPKNGFKIPTVKKLPALNFTLNK